MENIEISYGMYAIKTNIFESIPKFAHYHFDSQTKYLLRWRNTIECL